MVKMTIVNRSEDSCWTFDDPKHSEAVGTRMKYTYDHATLSIASVVHVPASHLYGNGVKPAIFSVSHIIYLHPLYLIEQGCRRSHVAIAYVTGARF
jgi:hypothetical protein